jgi:hypothetical protein
MLKVLKPLGITTLISASLIGLTGCGGDDASSKSKPASETSNSTSNETNTEVEESASTEETTVPEEALYAEGLKEDLAFLTENQLELSQESYDFIVANHTLFPAKTNADIEKAKKMTDSSINVKLLNKNVQPYLSKVASFEGDVVTVEEKPLENGDTLSVTHVLDDEMYSYQVLMYKSTGDILEGDRVRFWGVPVGPSSFENVSGGTTNVQNFFGAHIEKVQQ